MKTDTIVVLILCVAASIGVIVYEILRVQKKHKDDLIIPLDAYDGDKFFYILGFVFIAMAYFSQSSDTVVYALTAAIMFLLTKFAKPLDMRNAKLDEWRAYRNKRDREINEYYRKHK